MDFSSGKGVARVLAPSDPNIPRACRPWSLLVPPVGWIRVTALGARFAARPGAPAKRVLESCAEYSSHTKLRRETPFQFDECAQLSARAWGSLTGFGAVREWSR
jgi:hypothetical protein